MAFLQIVLLDSELEDVLVNSVNCLRVLCVGNRDNQTAVTEGGAIEPLVEFLSNADSGRHDSFTTC